MNTQGKWTVVQATGDTPFEARYEGKIIARFAIDTDAYTFIARQISLRGVA